MRMVSLRWSQAGYQALRIRRVHVDGGGLQHETSYNSSNEHVAMTFRI
jgi:hypothetical protein